MFSLQKTHKAVEAACQKKGFPAVVLEDIQCNLLSLFWVSHFDPFYHSDFFHKLLDLCLSGHLPCGWQGKHPKGILLVY